MFVPRHIHYSSDSRLHVFTDASQIAYAATLYIVNGAESHLVTARTRLAPLNPKLTIPRLELMGALLGARIYHMFAESFDCSSPPVFWTDSETVRYWILGGPEVLKTFESNRIKEIIEKSTSVWKRVSTEMNPADLATRGVTWNDLQESSLWFHGPAFLTEPENEWPQMEISPNQEQIHTAYEEERNLLTITVDPEPPLPRNHLRAVRVMSLVLQFGDLTRGRYLPDKPYFNLALQHLIRRAQMEEFPNDFQRLSNGSHILASSRLCHLRPFLDPNSRIIMVRGRTYPDKPLPLIPSTSALFRRMVLHYHISILHSGPRHTIAEFLRHYHVLRSASSIKRALSVMCHRCRRLYGVPFRSQEAPLPNFRITPTRPFSHVGLDYCGPFLCDNRKTYILLFTCAVVRAVHLEVTPNMSAETTIRAFRRFIARRGKPILIYSDNALSFLNVRSHLDVTWKLIPPKSPWWGGFYERMIGLVKRSLRATLYRSSISLEEFLTVVMEVEEAVNRRPLVVNEDGGNVLSPAHFLHGIGPTSEDLIPLEELDFLKEWGRRQEFSKRCFRTLKKEYFTQLRNWRSHEVGVFEPKVGDVVLVKDSMKSRLKWPLGKVVGVGPHHLEIIINGWKTQRTHKDVFPLEASTLTTESSPL